MYGFGLNRLNIVLEWVVFFAFTDEALLTSVYVVALVITTGAKRVFQFLRPLIPVYFLSVVCFGVHGFNFLQLLLIFRFQLCTRCPLSLPLRLSARK